MFARMSTIEGKPELIEAGIRSFNEQMLPAAKKMGGFQKAMLMVDRKNSKSIGITFWDTEKNLRASSATANKLREQANQSVAAARPPVVEIYEVAIQA